MVCLISHYKLKMERDPPFYRKTGVGVAPQIEFAVGDIILLTICYLISHYELKIRRDPRFTKNRGLSPNQIFSGRYYNILSII